MNHNTKSTAIPSKSKRPLMGKMRNRNISKSRFLYLYIIFSGISMFSYGIACVFTGWPWYYVFLPIVFLIGWFLEIMTYKNWKMIWMFVNNVNQGRLYLALSDNTHFEQKNKLRLVKWVYPRKNQVRNETWLSIGEKLRTGHALTPDEKRNARKKVVVCPQQVLDGVNRAILVYVLIYAHKNICVLDDEVREKLELTDDNMDKFRLEDEIEKCKKVEYKKKYDEMIEIGMKNMNASKQ